MVRVWEISPAWFCSTSSLAGRAAIPSRKRSADGVWASSQVVLISDSEKTRSERVIVRVIGYLRSLRS